MGAGIAGHLARHGLTVTLVDASLRSPSRPVSGCSRARAGTSTPGCSTRRRSSGRPRSRSPAQLGAADLVIEAVPEDLELKQRGPGRDRTGADRRHEHVVAADRRAGDVGARTGAFPRRALVQPAGVDAGDRGHPGPGHRPRGRRRRRSSCCARRASGRPRSPTARASSPTGCRPRSCARRSPASRKASPRPRRSMRSCAARSASGCRSTGRSRSPTWPGSTSTRASFARSSATSARSSRRRGRSASRSSRAGSGPSPARASREYADADALIQERDRRYAALSALLAELDR